MLIEKQLNVAQIINPMCTFPFLNNLNSNKIKYLVQLALLLGPIELVNGAT